MKFVTFTRIKGKISHAFQSFCQRLICASMVERQANSESCSEREACMGAESNLQFKVPVPLFKYRSSVKRQLQETLEDLDSSGRPMCSYASFNVWLSYIFMSLKSISLNSLVTSNSRHINNPAKAVDGVVHMVAYLMNRKAFRERTDSVSNIAVITYLPRKSYCTDRRAGNSGPSSSSRRSLVHRGKKKISGLRCTEMFSKDIETDYLRELFFTFCLSK